MRRAIGAGVVLAALLLTSGRAARASDPKLEAARAHWQEGDAYYKLEKYAQAITEYEQAYLAKPDPSFLYNIAQCHRLMGEGAEAIKFYRRFLKDAPNTPNRAIAEKHIRDLEDAPVPVPSSQRPAPAPPLLGTPAPVTLLAPAPTAAPPALSAAAPAPAPTSAPVTTPPVVDVERGGPPSSAEPRPIISKWWFWVGVGAALAGGIVLIAATANHDPSCPGDYSCH